MCDSEGCEKDDYDPLELVPGEEHWYGSTIEACVKVLPQPAVSMTPSMKSTGSGKKRRDSAIGKVLTRVKSVIMRSR